MCIPQLHLFFDLIQQWGQTMVHEKTTFFVRIIRQQLIFESSVRGDAQERLIKPKMQEGLVEPKYFR